MFDVLANSPTICNWLPVAIVSIPSPATNSKTPPTLTCPCVEDSSAKYKRIGKITYSFSHFDLDIDIYKSKVMKKNYKNFNWIQLNKIDTSGMPTVMKEIVKRALI